LLVVSFAPADNVTLAAFQTAYGITNLNQPIVGPYTGKLGNRSNRVGLERPQPPDAVGQSFSWIVVDEVTYGNQSPWPPSAHGGGHSLHRISPSQSGDDPANWIAGPPTPGLHQTAITTAPELTLQFAGGQLQLTWPATHIGCRLEAQTNALATGLSTNWVTISGSALTNQITIPIHSENDAAFFRLVYP
jgi:hypothetical protein